MKNFEDAKLITTEYKPYFGSFANVWGQDRAPLYQHTDLVFWNGLPMFLGDFDAENGSACLRFSALGVAEIYINGKKVNDSELEPSWTDYNKRAMFVDYDVTPFISEGKNRILAVVSGGWYAGRISGGYYGDTSPAFIAEIKQNDKVIFATDTDMLCKIGGQVRTADIWDGECRDDREDSYEKISTVGYVTGEWKNAELKTGFNGEFTEYIGTKIKNRKELALKPAKITVFDGVEYNGTYFGKIHTCCEDAKLPLKLCIGQKLIVDFAQESVGRLKVSLKGKIGTEVKMRYAEFLNDSGELSRGNDGAEGDVYTINLRSALGKANYIIGTEEKTDYNPTHTFFGYRYVQLCATEDIEIFDLTAEVVGNDNEEIGKVETSDALVNKLISNTRWGQRSNYLAVPTDCPQRDERLGWTGDAQAFSTTAAYNADVYGFFRKWMQDMRDSQSESGGFADVNPRVGCCHSEDACAWADAGVIIPYNMYKIYGDKTIIEEHFDAMEKYIDGLIEKYGYSGPIPRYGDWLAYDWCDNKFNSSAYFVHDLDLLIYMSEVIGKADKVQKFKDIRVKAKAYFDEHFMKDGKPVEQTQCNKIIVLAFDLTDEKNAKELADMLEKQIHENGDRLSCGFLGTYNLCPALSKYGKDKMAYNLLMQRNEPSWLYSIDQGATTIWERWNSYTKETGFGDVGMNSFNHYAYGAIVEWMYRYMAGIEVDEPGFGKFILAPKIDFRKDCELPEGQKQMKFVKAEYKSRAGLIKSEWNTEKGLEYKCAVPCGAVAKLVLPVVADKVVINGVEHKCDEYAENGSIVMMLSAGEYEFVQ